MPEKAINLTEAFTLSQQRVTEPGSIVGIYVKLDNQPDMIACYLGGRYVSSWFPANITKAKETMSRYRKMRGFVQHVDIYGCSTTTEAFIKAANEAITKNPTLFATIEALKTPV